MARPDHLPIWFQRIESAVIAALVAVALVKLDFAWWYLVALFLLFDLSMLGYLRNPRVGAWAYNAVHSYAAPAALGIVSLATDSRCLAFAMLVWSFHIAVDRGLGYGLKFQDRFTSTHLGDIGRARGTDR